MSPYFPDDADQVLADFGEDLVCSAAPAVTRGLIDDAVADDEFGETRVGRQVVVLKVKRGAFGDVKVKDTRVTNTSTNKQYSIDEPLPRPSSLFDYYALQPVRTRANA